MELRHIGISVRNLKKALTFYVDLLGFIIIEQEILKGKYINQLLGYNILKYVKLMIDKKNILELYEEKRFPNGVRNNHIAFTVKDIEEIYNKLKDRIYFLSEPIIDKDRKHKLVFCQDFDDNLIELVENL